MFKLVECEGVVRVPPSLMTLPLREAVLQVLRSEYGSQVVKDLGIIISVLDADASEYGAIVPGDGALYHKARFTFLVYQPMLQEVVEGEVAVVESTGLLVRLGPIEGYIHKSQIMDDVVSYSREQNVVIGEKSGRVLRKGDVVRARIVGVSYGSRKQALRVQLTMRQHCLGKIEWIREEVSKKLAKAEAKGGER